MRGTDGTFKPKACIDAIKVTAMAFAAWGVTGDETRAGATMWPGVDVWDGVGKTSTVFWGLLGCVFRVHETRVTMGAVAIATVAITQTTIRNLCLLDSLYFTCISCKYVP